MRPFTTRFRRILRAGVSRLRPATTFYLVTRDWTARPLTQVGTDARAKFPCFQSITLVHQTRTAVCKKKKEENNTRNYGETEKERARLFLKNLRQHWLPPKLGRNLVASFLSYSAFPLVSSFRVYEAGRSPSMTPWPNLFKIKSDDSLLRVQDTRFLREKKETTCNFFFCVFSFKYAVQRCTLTRITHHHTPVFST